MSSQATYKFIIGAVVVVVLIAIVLIIVFVQIPVYIYVPAIVTVIVLGATSYFMVNANGNKYIANNIATINLEYKKLDANDAMKKAKDMVNNDSFVKATTEKKLSEIKNAYSDLSNDNLLDVLRISNALLMPQYDASISEENIPDNNDMLFIQKLIDNNKNDNNKNDYLRIYSICDKFLSSAVSTAISSTNIRATRGNLRVNLSTVITNDTKKRDILTNYYICKFNTEIASKITGDIGVYDKDLLDSDNLSDDTSNDTIAKEIVCYIIKDIRAISDDYKVNISYIAKTIENLLLVNADHEKDNTSLRTRIFYEVYHLLYLYADDPNPVDIQYNQLLADKRHVSIKDINIPVSTLMDSTLMDSNKYTLLDDNQPEYNEGAADPKATITSIVNSIDDMPSIYISNEMQSTKCKNLIDKIEQLRTDMPLASASVFDKIYDYIIGKYLAAVSQHNNQHQQQVQSGEFDKPEYIIFVCKLINFKCNHHGIIDIKVPENTEFRNNIKNVTNDIIIKYNINMDLVTRNMLNYYMQLLSYKLMSKNNVKLEDIYTILDNIKTTYSNTISKRYENDLDDIVNVHITSLLDDAFSTCTFTIGKLPIGNTDYNALFNKLGLKSVQPPMEKK